MSYVYFITGDPYPYVKIGYTRSNPFARLKELQTGCPDHLFVLTYVRATPEEERLLHETFEVMHYRGEWFINECKLNDFLNYLTNFHEKIEEECPRQRFEDALWDVVITGYSHPDDPLPQLYERSGNGSCWMHLFPEEAASE